MRSAVNRFLQYHIEEPYIGMTIGQFLKDQGYSNPILVHLKKTSEGILLNGVWAYVNQKLSQGDILSIQMIEETPSEHIPPTPIDLEAFQEIIVYEDDDILLIDKPAGLPVHPSLGHYEDTLANYCAYYFGQKPALGAFVFRCVNRLDRDTSGLVLIAKNMLSSAILSTSQHRHDIKRTYLAIATGQTPKEGTINAPIARKENSIIERCVNFNTGETAVTHYEQLACLPIDDTCFSLLKIQLETGRTHQIRVHMQHIGHPLPGDFLYQPDMRYIQRQALHSYILEFTHPITKQVLSFKKRPPKDFYFLPWEV